MEELQTNTKEPKTERDIKKCDDNKENAKADNKNQKKINYTAKIETQN